MGLQIFTTGQKLAWDYIRSAVDQGIKPTAALRDYREAGHKIRTQDWFRSYKSYSEMGDTWDRLGTFKPHETVSQSFWLASPRNFAKRYVVEVHLAWRNLITNELENVHRYIQSNHRMSQTEIQQGIDNLIEERNRCSLFEPEGLPTKLEFVYGMKFFEKGTVK